MSVLGGECFCICGVWLHSVACVNGIVLMSLCIRGSRRCVRVCGACSKGGRGPISGPSLCSLTFFRAAILNIELSSADSSRSEQTGAAPRRAQAGCKSPSPAQHLQTPPPANGTTRSKPPRPYPHPSMTPSPEIYPRSPSQAPPAATIGPQRSFPSSPKQHRPIIIQKPLEIAECGNGAGTKRRSDDDRRAGGASA